MALSYSETKEYVAHDQVGFEARVVEPFRYNTSFATSRLNMDDRLLCVMNQMPSSVPAFLQMAMDEDTDSHTEKSMLLAAQGGIVVLEPTLTLIRSDGTSKLSTHEGPQGTTNKKVVRFKRIFLRLDAVSRLHTHREELAHLEDFVKDSLHGHGCNLVLFMSHTQLLHADRNVLKRLANFINNQCYKLLWIISCTQETDMETLEACILDLCPNYGVGFRQSLFFGLDLTPVFKQKSDPTKPTVSLTKEAKRFMGSRINKLRFFYPTNAIPTLRRILQSNTDMDYDSICYNSFNMHTIMLCKGGVCSYDNIPAAMGAQRGDVYNPAKGGAAFNRSPLDITANLDECTYFVTQSLNCARSQINRLPFRVRAIGDKMQVSKLVKDISRQVLTSKKVKEEHSKVSQSVSGGRGVPVHLIRVSHSHTPHFSKPDIQEATNAVLQSE
jgi:hypothetical protein